MSTTALTTVTAAILWRGLLLTLSLSHMRGWTRRTNARGDVVSLTDKTSGYPIVATYRYGPWGELLSAEGTCAGQPIRYADYYWSV